MEEWIASEVKTVSTTALHCSLNVFTTVEKWRDKYKNRAGFACSFLFGADGLHKITP